jgi:hypothetical protein
MPATFGASRGEGHTQALLGHADAPAVKVRRHFVTNVMMALAGGAASPSL